MRLMGLLVIVGMVAGCGEEPQGSDAEPAVAGVYHADLDKSVMQEVEIRVMLDPRWRSAATDSAKAEVVSELTEDSRVRFASYYSDLRLVIRDDETWSKTWDFDRGGHSVAPRKPRTSSGDWRLGGNELTLRCTHLDGKVLGKPFEDRFALAGGELHVTAVERSRLLGPHEDWAAFTDPAADGESAAVILLQPVMVKGSP